LDDKKESQKMPAFLLNKNVLAGIVILILSGVLYGIYHMQASRITSLTDSLTRLEKEVLAKQVQISSLEDSVLKIENSVTRTSEETKKLFEKQEAISVDVKEKLKVFEGERLKSLAAKKPGLIERKVNTATIKVFEEIEKETQDFKGNNQ